MTKPIRFAGWSVVWVAFAVATCAWGISFYGPSVFLQTLHTTRGWSIATISTAITAHFLFSAVIVSQLPAIHRRFGLADVTSAGIVASALGIIAWASVTEPWHLYGAAMLTGAGWALTSGAAINAMISRWFDADRPKALSMAFNGASVGGIVIAPLWVFLIGWLGYQNAAVLMAIAMLVIVVPLIQRHLHRSPVDLGLAVDGGLITTTTSTIKPPAALTRSALLGDRRFLTISAAFALGLFAQIGIVSHLIARLAPDIGAGLAASAVSLVATCAILGRTVLGSLIGNRDRRIAAALNFLLQACGVGLLAIATGMPALALGCVLFGLGVGNLISLPPLIAQKEFERGDVATVVALATAINQAVFAFAPGIIGALRDATLSYTLPFALAACVQIVAALIIVLGRRPRNVRELKE